MESDRWIEELQGIIGKEKVELFNLPLFCPTLSFHLTHNYNINIELLLDDFRWKWEKFSTVAWRLDLARVSSSCYIQTLNS